MPEDWAGVLLASADHTAMVHPITGANGLLGPIIRVRQSTQKQIKIESFWSFCRILPSLRDRSEQDTKLLHDRVKPMNCIIIYNLQL